MKKQQLYSSPLMQEIEVKVACTLLQGSATGFAPGSAEEVEEVERLID